MVSVSLYDEFELPDGAIPNGAVAVCQYLDADGEMKFVVTHEMCELPLSSTLGLLELAKQHLYSRSQEDSET